MPTYLARTDAGLVVSCWIVMSCQANKDGFAQVSRSPEVKVQLKDGERATAEEFKEFCKGKIAHYKILRCLFGLNSASLCVGSRLLTSDFRH